MKLYTEIRASKLQGSKYITVSKGQGSNEQINININIDSEQPKYRLHINKRKDDSTDICLVDLEKAYPYNTVFQETIKGKKHIHDYDNFGKCCDCGKWKVWTIEKQLETKGKKKKGEITLQQDLSEIAKLESKLSKDNEWNSQ